MKVEPPGGQTLARQYNVIYEADGAIKRKTTTKELGTVGTMVIRWATVIIRTRMSILR